MTFGKGVRFAHERHWIPAFAGMTQRRSTRFARGPLRHLILPSL